MSTTPAPAAYRPSPLPRLAVTLVLSVFTLYFLTPIWWLLVASTKSRGDLTSTNPLWFSDLNLVENLQGVFSYSDGILPRWLLNSVLYAGRLSADRTEIEGAWTIPGIWSGRFLMMRGEKAEEAELRRAWEEA